MKYANNSLTLEEGDFIDYIKSFNYVMDYNKFEKLIYNCVSSIAFKKYSYNKKKICSYHSTEKIEEINKYNLKLNSVKSLVPPLKFKTEYFRKLYINSNIIVSYMYYKSCMIVKTWIPTLITYLIKLFKKHNIKNFECDLNIDPIDIYINTEKSKLFNYLSNSIRCKMKNVFLNTIAYILKKSLNRNITENDLLLDHDFIQTNNFNINKKVSIETEYQYIDIEIIV